MGAARGGTSIVASTLVYLGIFMGDGANPPVFEDTRLVDCLEDREALLRVVEEYNGRFECWGFKRPAVIQHLSTLHPLLQDPVYLFVFRDVLALANRNTISMGSDPVQSMRQALDSYHTVLDFIQQVQPNGLLLSVEKALVRPADFVDQLVSYLHLKSTAEQRQQALDYIQVDPTLYLLASRHHRVGQVEVAYPGVVQGWAFAATDDSPQKLVISVNGMDAGETTADQACPELALRGAHPTGLCGFRYPFPSGFANVGDSLAVRFAGTEQFLPGLKMIQPG